MRRDARLRIRFEHTHFPHWGSRSGYVRLVDHLDPARFRAAVHGASDSHADLPRLLAPLRPHLRRRLRRGRMPWYKLSDLNAEMAAFAACLARRCDIVHFLDGEHAPRFLPGWLGAPGRRPAKVIATYHQPPGLLGDLVDPGVVRQLDHVLLVAPSQRRFFEPLLPAERIHVLLHGVDTSFFHPAPPAPRPPGPLRCITVGAWLRDWQVVGAVAARLPEVDFDVVTGRATGLERRANVRLHRGLEDAELAALYRAADLLFLPLLESTANNALLEGIASGLPVVTSDIAAVRAYLGDADQTLVAPGCVDGFAAALAQLRDDEGLRAALGARARRRAEALAWPRLIADYEALYRQL